jgi:hypothetical protein
MLTFIFVSGQTENLLKEAVLSVVDSCISYPALASNPLACRISHAAEKFVA